jgi:glycosyltransferase involved in cell wall biosynthesis
VRFAAPTDPQSFAAAIARTLDEKDETRRLVAAARERAHRFTWGACAERTLAVYRQLTCDRRRFR